MASEYPLRSDRKEFRLLRIHPRFPSVPNTVSPFVEPALIQCDLFVASRDNPPDYQALSYAWGSPVRTVPIQVNGKTHQINWNLYTAFVYIREKHDEVIIWVDAICIDQDNNDEKSEQVMNMTEIYASAKCTIVWLGLARDGSDHFMEWCNEMGRGLLNPKTVGDMTVPNIVDLIEELMLVPTETTAGLERFHYLKKQLQVLLDSFVGDPQQDASHILSILAEFKLLLSRGYWSRVWIHQEFVVSSNIVIQCGKSKLNEPELRASMLYLTQITGHLMEKLSEIILGMHTSSPRNIRLKLSKWVLDECPESNYDPDLANARYIRKIFNDLRDYEMPKVVLFGIRRRYQEFRTGDKHKDFTLMRTLASVFVNGVAEATNAKDRIFAMIGMASDKEELGLKPNYSESISDIEVYTDAARAVITAGHVDLLSLSQHQPHLNNGQEGAVHFPSWVPNWDNPIERPSGQLPYNTFFAASGSWHFEKPLELLSCHYKRLELYGCVLDQIEELSPVWIPPEVSSLKEGNKITKFLSDIKAICMASDVKFSNTGHDIYFRASDRESAHYLIPTCDQERNLMGFIRPAGKDLKEKYENMFNGSHNIYIGMEKARYLETMRLQKYRRPFLSTLGYVGLAPKFTEHGDTLVIFCGAKFPYVLRCNGDGTYKFVGDAYVHGVMHGEFMEKAREKKRFILQ